MIERDRAARRRAIRNGHGVMDVLTNLSEATEYSMPRLQAIIAAWVMSAPMEPRGKVARGDGHVDESEYRKQSIYSLLYSLYRSLGSVENEHGERYQFTFNTWGYAWPEAWGPPPAHQHDPQRFGRNAYSGLFHFDAVQQLARERGGRLHVVELGCGTGAGADHVCTSVLPKCTYEAIDMQLAGVSTCRAQFAPKHRGRLVATHADATRAPIDDEVADVVAVCETHVTDQGEVMTEEDRKFFRSARRILKRGGFLAWGNSIPEQAWASSFEFLASIGMEVVAVDDVTDEAVLARDLDDPRIQAYVAHALARFPAFRIPVYGPQRRVEAELAMRNLCRAPGTRLYDDLATRRDPYRVILARRT
ncbi:class I SAM-dependent methyltransferase [Sandaracinus amylolyticus]|nr:class I SAM-dependent methyltransferase [Sandaracinus amylolyticus]